MSSLPKDLGVKARVCAAAGVPTYWVLDLRRELTLVPSEPRPTGYDRVEPHPFAAPLQAVGVTVRLADLLA